MSPDEEFVRRRHPEAALVEISDPGTSESRWCVHYHAEIDSRIMGHGNTMEEAWANARANCANDPVIA